MNTLDPRSIDRCFVALEAAIRRDPVLCLAFTASRLHFAHAEARADQVVAADPEGALVARRRLEWFALEDERTGDELERLEVCFERAAGTEPDAEAVKRSLAESHASVFEVTHVDPGRGVSLWDLAGLFECAAVEESGSRALAEGDVIAGRVFPLGDATYHLSSAAEMWRNPRLLAALRHDLERARAGRSGPQRGTFRLRQSELEAMFHAIPAPEPAPNNGSDGREAIGEAQRLLTALGLEAGEIDEILGRLAADVVRQLLPGERDALGEVLVDLAFETSIDLEAARRVLLSAAAALRDGASVAAPLGRGLGESGSVAPPGEESPSGEPEGGELQVGELEGGEAGRGDTPPGARPRGPSPSLLIPHGRAPTVDVDVAAAVAEFDRKRREGAPLEDVFRDLERDLELIDTADEPAAESDDEDSPVPDFPGVVAAVVEEFLWDVGREDGAATARRFEGLRSFGAFAEHVGVFENLSGRDVLDYACRWLPERPQLAGAAIVGDLLDALDRFLFWAQENHDVHLHDELAPLIEALRHTLPRIAAANDLLGAESARRREPSGRDRRQAGEELFEFVAPGNGGAAELRDAAGEPEALTLDPRLEKLLERGDLLRGARTPGGSLTVSGCYPQQLCRLQQAI